MSGSDPIILTPPKKPQRVAKVEKKAAPAKKKERK